MAKKVPLDRLAESIGKILEEYGEDTVKDVDAAVRKAAQAGARTLRAESKAKFGGKGKYASGWTAKIEKERLGTTGIIHNARTPGLPHLLEHGHANRGGGRTPGRTHIAPVEDKLVRDFESVLRKKL